MADDLSTPLGQTAKPKKRRLLASLPMPQIIIGLLGLCLVVFLGWAAMVDDPLGGEPMIVVSADVRAPGQKPGENAAAPASRSQASPAATAAASGAKTITIIDGMSGKRQEVVLGTPAANGEGSAPTPASPSAPQQAPAVDLRVAEASPHGSIPKIGTDGARPAEVYARPVKAASANPGPRVVIVVGGLGIGASTTFEALGKLPGPVTLAFTPYGTDLARWISRARGEGHEVLLQVPMEPFDYPENDPGPQTLLTSLTPEQNIDRLHWFMSRFQGYVGIASFMGARFTSNEPALGQVMRENAKRGLIYFDDASSPRSFAGQIAGANNVPFAKADVVLDAVPTPAAIDGSLARLETAARERGIAVGVASVSPAAIDRISQWVKAAEARGFTLVPISAVANKPKSS